MRERKSDEDQGIWKCTQNRQSFCCWTCIKWYYRYHVMSVDAKQSKGRWIVGVDERNQPWMMSWEKKDEEERVEKEKNRGGVRRKSQSRHQFGDEGYFLFLWSADTLILWVSAKTATTTTTKKFYMHISHRYKQIQYKKTWWVYILMMELLLSLLIL